MSGGQGFATGVALALLAGCAHGLDCPKGSRPAADREARVLLCVYAEPASDGSERAHFRRLWPGGAVHSEGEYRGGRKSGTWVEGWMNGRPRERGAYVAGEREGAWTSWHPEGGVHVRREYRAGKLHGPYAMRDREGRLVELGHFADDLRDGRWLRFYPGSKGAVETVWERGRELGSRELAPDEAARLREAP